MKPTNIPEMRDYLCVLRKTKGCDALYRVEIEELRKVGRDTEDLDWADLKGTEVMADYFFLAVDPARRGQLAEVSHLRAKAWFAVWNYFEISNRPALTPADVDC